MVVVQYGRSSGGGGGPLRSVQCPYVNNQWARGSGGTVVCEVHLVRIGRFIPVFCMNVATCCAIWWRQGRGDSGGGGSAAGAVDKVGR